MIRITNRNRQLYGCSGILAFSLRSLTRGVACIQHQPRGTRHEKRPPTRTHAALRQRTPKRTLYAACSMLPASCSSHSPSSRFAASPRQYAHDQALSDDGRRGPEADGQRRPRYGDGPPGESSADWTSSRNSTTRANATAPRTTPVASVSPARSAQPISKC